MTITIKDKTFTSDISLAGILNVMTKVEMLKICDKLELYVSPNLKKDETARRVAHEILDNPCDVLHLLRAVIPLKASRNPAYERNLYRAAIIRKLS